ncbi:MAG TPA: hypothetical protein VLA19_07395, partial [Herpetosiphonaceae bacterium]|nr:hypothetical protein [Herpetosiphonaceae bacterium]
ADPDNACKLQSRWRTPPVERTGRAEQAMARAAAQQEQRKQHGEDLRNAAGPRNVGGAARKTWDPAPLKPGPAAA